MHTYFTFIYFEHRGGQGECVETNEIPRFQFRILFFKSRWMLWMIITIETMLVRHP